MAKQTRSSLANPPAHNAGEDLERTDVTEPPQVSLKDLLAAAPLDEIDLERPRDSGRNIEL